MARMIVKKRTVRVNRPATAAPAAEPAAYRDLDSWPRPQMAQTRHFYKGDHYSGVVAKSFTQWSRRTGELALWARVEAFRRFRVPLFLSQQNEWIDPRGSSGRNRTREYRGSYEKEGDDA